MAHCFCNSNYCAIRIILYLNFELNTPIGHDSGIRLFTALPFKFKLPAALFSSLKLNLILEFLAISQLIRSKIWILAIMSIIIVAIIFLISTAVEDVTRSLAYAFPLVMVFYHLSSQNASELNTKRLFICIVTFGNLLLPTYSLLLRLYQIPLFN